MLLFHWFNCATWLPSKSVCMTGKLLCTTISVIILRGYYTSLLKASSVLFFLRWWCMDGKRQQLKKHVQPQALFFQTRAILTNKTKYLTRDQTPLASMANISKIIYLPLHSWSSWLYGKIFLIDNTFSAADMGFNCFKLLINCRLLSLSIFKTLVEIHPFPVVQSK